MGDAWTIYASLTSSIGLVAGGAHWLAQRWINHRLEREMKQYQAAIDERLARAKADYEATLRRELETYLGEQSAERAYRFDAKKRLYAAVGPLRFQLVNACSEVVSRVLGMAGKHESYSLTLTGYYGASTLHRFLRPLALLELIERQMAYADFSVDPDVILLLRFKRAVIRALTDALAEADGTDWDYQRDHLFKDTLVNLAVAAIIKDKDGKERAIRFDELREALSSDPNFEKRCAPLPKWLEQFDITEQPLIWARFAAYARACDQLVREEGLAIGYEPKLFDTAAVLAASKNHQLLSRGAEYTQQIEHIATSIKRSSA